MARVAAIDLTLNPMAQGGGNGSVLGFPSSGHAHNKGSSLQ